MNSVGDAVFAEEVVESASVDRHEVIVCALARVPKLAEATEGPSEVACVLSPTASWILIHRSQRVVVIHLKAQNVLRRLGFLKE